MTIPEGGTTDITEFEVLFKKQFTPLCNKVFVLIKDADLAADIVQNVFFKYWVNRKKISIQLSIEAYLYRACINEAHNHLKSAKRRKDLNTKATYNVLLHSNQVEDQIQFDETVLRVEKIIESLPPGCKEVFLLSRYDEMNHKEIATHLNISVNTVSNHIKKALKVLRDSLSLLIAFIKICG